MRANEHHGVAMTTATTLTSVLHDLRGRELDLGEVTVTAEMIARYMEAVGDETSPALPHGEAPPSFCLALRGGMIPHIQLPPDRFGVYGGHDLEFHRPIRAGERYHLTGRITDVYDKMGRSGALTIIAREVLIRDSGGRTVARIIERQIVRQRPTERVE
jgi:acyl dehydratase